ncbi:PIG-L deacetylase family protein [Paludisphaera mucosa]|uniref:PIG-L family deacetylase n=1 Tax=Paludisphaera mucosa TaxID=3030827 RepID=A0ABT6FAI9_9BACT|nr:PIG-L family deacetylase [Paludisphaera mucosa]MDG3004496.1 PIG-L family deacetylase [Paludisphaera mucosa]
MNHPPGGRRPTALAPALTLALACLLLTDARGPSARGGETAMESKKTYRIIVFGAHPDDCELTTGGTAARWVDAGHAVKFVSLTNGDAGHHEISGGPLARRRREESVRASKILGVESQTLDNHDAELLPTLENRKAVARAIREWKADLVLAPRPNDYHPDHRYTGILVQDTAYMVAVPNFCPDTPALKTNPVFLYVADRFQQPNPFRPDVVVPIDPVFDRKVAALAEMDSQFFEWLPWIDGYLDQVPKDAAARKTWFKEQVLKRYGASADRFRDKLVDLLGPERGKAVQTAEAFQVCEYGRQPNRAELLEFFPFFGEAAK